jgi:hypothetical protein
MGNKVLVRIVSGAVAAWSAGFDPEPSKEFDPFKHGVSRRGSELHRGWRHIGWRDAITALANCSIETLRDIASDRITGIIARTAVDCVPLVDMNAVMASADNRIVGFDRNRAGIRVKLEQAVILRMLAGLRISSRFHMHFEARERSIRDNNSRFSLFGTSIEIRQCYLR